MASTALDMSPAVLAAAGAAADSCCTLHAAPLLLPHQPFNVLKYEVGDKNEAHLDTYDPEKFGPQRSQRIATMVIYLNDVEAGGETMFKQEGIDGESDRNLY